MKTIKTISAIFILSILISSCGFNTAMTANQNNNNTNVELSRKNFKVIEKVSGTSTATYFLGFGGISNKALIDIAKTNMLKNANLVGSSKALVNVTTESHVTAILNPIYLQRTVIVSGHIIEFTE